MGKKERVMEVEGKKRMREWGEKEKMGREQEGRGKREGG